MDIKELKWYKDMNTIMENNKKKVKVIFLLLTVAIIVATAGIIAYGYKEDISAIKTGWFMIIFIDIFFIMLMVMTYLKYTMEKIEEQLDAMLPTDEYKTLFDEELGAAKKKFGTIYTKNFFVTIASNPIAMGNATLLRISEIDVMELDRANITGTLWKVGFLKKDEDTIYNHLLFTNKEEAKDFINKIEKAQVKLGIKTIEEIDENDE